MKHIHAKLSSQFTVKSNEAFIHSVYFTAFERRKSKYKINTATVLLLNFNHKNILL